MKNYKNLVDEFSDNCDMDEHFDESSNFKQKRKPTKLKDEFSKRKSKKLNKPHHFEKHADF